VAQKGGAVLVSEGTGCTDKETLIIVTCGISVLKISLRILVLGFT
jgi:hypothetical protein